MAMDFKVMAKDAGLSENELNGKSLDEQIKLITQRMTEGKKVLETEAAKEYIDNYKTKFPKIKELLETPFEIYIKEVWQKKSSAVVQVVGYNSHTKSAVVIFSGKLYQIKDSDLIKSVEEWNTDKPKAKRKHKEPKNT
jgi:hypothetical protein